MSGKISGWEILRRAPDVAGNEETSLLANIDACQINLRATGNILELPGTVDILAVGGAGRVLDATKMQLIFTHSHATDADGTTSIFELHASADGGPRMEICNLTLTAGKAQFAGVDEVCWVDTVVATNNYRTTGVIIDNSGVDRIARVSVHLRGLRYWEGRFTGAASTAVTATAYYRIYETEFAVG